MLLEKKSSLRSKLLLKRNSLSEVEILFKTNLIFEKLFSLSIINLSTVVHCYCSNGSEVNTTKILSNLLSLKKTVSVPIVNDLNLDLSHSILDTSTVFVQGKYNIPIPKEPQFFSISQLNQLSTIVIVPLVGFDACCNRIGYGKGFYDRFLQKIPNAKKIGIAFAMQEVQTIPIENTDIPLDIIITEETIFYR